MDTSSGCATSGRLRGTSLTPWQLLLLLPLPLPLRRRWRWSQLSVRPSAAAAPTAIARPSSLICWRRGVAQAARCSSAQLLPHTARCPVWLLSNERADLQTCMNVGTVREREHPKAALVLRCGARMVSARLVGGSSTSRQCHGTCRIEGMRPARPCRPTGCKGSQQGRAGACSALEPWRSNTRGDRSPALAPSSSLQLAAAPTAAHRRLAAARLPLAVYNPRQPTKFACHPAQALGHRAWAHACQLPAPSACAAALKLRCSRRLSGRLTGAVMSAVPAWTRRSNSRTYRLGPSPPPLRTGRGGRQLTRWQTGSAARGRWAR